MVELTEKAVASLCCRIDKAEIAIRENQLEKMKCSNLLAKHNCPFEVGQVIVANKTRATVESIFNTSGFKSGFVMTIRKFKQNGEPFKVTSQAYDFQNWQAE